MAATENTEKRASTKNRKPAWDENGRPIYLKGEPTPYKEAFAKAYITTHNWTEAYRRAYNAKNMNAHTIKVAVDKLKGDAFVVKRVSELQKELAERTMMTLERLTNMLLEDRQLAHQEGQAAAAVQATAHIAKMHGIYVDTRVNIHRDEFDSMSAEELRAYIADRAKALEIRGTGGHLLIEAQPEDYTEEEEEAQE
jgi:phage terminase small subunit